MKKGLIITTTLAMALGVGVAVGAHHSEVRVAKAYGADENYWYVAGSFNEWDLQDAHAHLTYSKFTDNNWEYESDEYIQFEEGDEFKFVYSWGGTSETTIYFTPQLMTNSSDFTGGSGNNFVASRDIKVKFFLQIYGSDASWTGVYWQEYEEPEPVVEPDYYLKVYNTYYKFELDEDGKPEGVVHQYSATPEGAYRAREAEFYQEVDEVKTKITEGIGIDRDGEGHVVPGNNIVEVNGAFKFYHYADAKVYLKIYSDGGKSIWGAGYDENSYSVTVKTAINVADRYYLSPDEDFVPYGDYQKQYKTSEAIAIKAFAGTEWASSNGLDCGGVSESVSPDPDASNNMRQAFQSTAWKVHNDCEEVIYLKEKTDLSLVMYIGGYEEAHVLTIGGKTVNLSDNGDGQYVAHGVALAAGDEVTSYTIEGVAQTVTSKAIGNNNLTEGKKVVANVESADIYYNVEAKTLWISGLPAAGQHLLKNGNTAIEMTHTDPYEGYDQYASGLLTFAANDTIKVLDTSSASSYAVTWCPEIVATSEKLNGNFVYDETNHEMKCVTACSAAVYLKIKSGVDEVYFGDVPEYVQDAVDFVNHFKGVMYTACGASQNKKNEVEAGWSTLANEFRALSEQAQAEVKLGGYSLVEEIQEFGERYIAIKQQHPDWNLENFLEWDIPNSGAYRVVTSDAVSENSTMIIIIAIAATSAIALGTLLIIKKRKHQ